MTGRNTTLLALFALAGCTGMQDMPEPTLAPERSRPEISPSAGDSSGAESPEPGEQKPGIPSSEDGIDALIAELDGAAADTSSEPGEAAPAADGPDAVAVLEAPTTSQEPPGELPPQFAEILRKQQGDADLDLDGDGKPEISMKRLPDGGAQIALSFPADGGTGTRRYRVDEDGRILRFVRDDDGDGRAEEILLSALGNSWFRAAEGENAYYIIQGSEESGKAQAWHDSGLLPAPLVLLRYIRAGEPSLGRLLAYPDVESHWQRGRRTFFHDRREKVLGAAFAEGMLSAGSKLLPHNKSGSSAVPPKSPIGDKIPPRGKIPGNPLPVMAALVAPKDYRTIPGLFILVSETDRVLLELRPFRHLVRGMPEELLTGPPGRSICRSAPGTYMELNRPVMYLDSEGEWKGWYDRDADGLREAKIVRWGLETVLEYPEEGQLVTELLYRRKLTEKRFRPPDEERARVIEYYGEGGLVRRELDADRDGRFDRFEFPDDGGFKVYVDSDGDGLPDKWLRKGTEDGGRSSSQTAGDAEAKP